jgi:hypothetical protein
MPPVNGYSLGFLACAVVAVTLGNLAFYRMLSFYNKHLPEQERFSWIGFHLGKNRRIIRAYKQMCPRGGLLWKYRLCIVSALLLLSASPRTTTSGDKPRSTLSIGVSRTSSR